MEKCFLNAFPGYLKFKCMYGVKVTPIMLKNIIKSVVYSCLVFDCFFNTITNTLISIIQLFLKPALKSIQLLSQV